MAGLTIGRLAEAAGVGVETVRFYERKGLIRRPPRPRQGYRSYPAGAVRQIRFIRQAQELGFTLREICELLDLRANPQGDCADVRERAHAKLLDVRRKQAKLQQLERALEHLVDNCPGRGSLKGCTILEAIELSAGGRA